MLPPAESWRGWDLDFGGAKGHGRLDRFAYIHWPRFSVDGDRLFLLFVLDVDPNVVSDSVADAHDYVVF